MLFRSDAVVSADHFAGRTWSICRVDGLARLVPYSDIEEERSDHEAIMSPKVHQANFSDRLLWVALLIGAIIRQSTLVW